VAILLLNRRLLHARGGGGGDGGGGGGGGRVIETPPGVAVLFAVAIGLLVGLPVVAAFAV
jgi:hypothetical protein